MTKRINRIEKRESSVIDVLLKNDDVSGQKSNSNNALDLFFLGHACLGNDPKMLKLLLLNGARIYSFQKRTIFQIALHANFEELRMLIDAGLDPKFLIIENQ